MKKIYTVVIAVIALTTMATAQKGTILKYGTLSAFKNTSSTNSTTSGIVVRPGLGYQFSNRWTLGLNLGYVSTKAEIGNTNNYDKANAYLVGPFIRYTKSLTDIFSVFAQGNFSYVHAITKPYSIFGSPTNTSNGFEGEIFPAIGVNIKNGFALNFAFGGIKYNTLTPSGGNGTSEFSVTFGNQVNIGISRNISGMCKKFCNTKK